MTGRTQDPVGIADDPAETTGTKKRAEVSTARMRTRESRPSAPDKEVTVAQHWQSWLGRLGQLRSGRAGRRDIKVIGQRYVLPALGARSLPDVAGWEIQRLLWMLRQGTAPTLRAPLGPAMVQAVHDILRDFFEDARRMGLIRVSPLEDGAALFPWPGGRTNGYWTVEQARVALRALWGESIYLPVRIALEAGLRRGEIAALAAEAIDWRTLTIHVVWSLSDTWGRQLTKPKVNAGRNVPISASLAAVLRPVVEAAAARPPVDVGNGASLHLLFAHADGSPLGDTWMLRGFHRWLSQHGSELGLPDVRFHDLRNSYALILIRGGVPCSIAAQLLGRGYLPGSRTSDGLHPRTSRATLVAVRRILEELNGTTDQPSMQRP